MIEAKSLMIDGDSMRALNNFRASISTLGLATSDQPSEIVQIDSFSAVRSDDAPQRFAETPA